jgi:predicted transcriptional regulator
MSEVARRAEPEPTDEKRNRNRRELARLLAQNGKDSVQVVSHETAREVLTDRRRELLWAIEEYSPASIRELAEQLDRDDGQVGRDLHTLAEHALVTFEQEGRGKRPVLTAETVVVEPIRWPER